MIFVWLLIEKQPYIFVFCIIPKSQYYIDFSFCFCYNYFTVTSTHILCTFHMIQTMENSMDTNLLKVGKYNNSFNSVLGINPNETRTDSIELIKRYKDNILIGIKLDKSSNYLYISTMYNIQESKIQRRLHSGRLKKFNIDKTTF